MIELSYEIETLIREKAAGTGRTPEQVLRVVLTHAGDVMPWRSFDTPPPANLSKEELIARMDVFAVRSAARPIADPRSINEIIGYDDFALPR